MRILLYTDVHWCCKSSIVNTKGNQFSTRLENLINSVNWAEEQADINTCDSIICLGDFFDTPTLNAEEITALQCVKWSKLHHYFLVGNHESNIADLSKSSTQVLKALNFDVIDNIECRNYNNTEFYFIPYMVEENRPNIKDIVSQLSLNNNSNKIIFSHNDIQMQYGAYKSKQGFTIDDIKDNCNLFLNGHLHNGEQFCDNGYNLGNLTGKNFSEDAFKYNHGAYILDTDTNKLKFIENPYAFNFYKLIIENENDLNKINNLKSNAVVTIKCVNTLLESCKNLIKSKDIKHYKLLTYSAADTSNITEVTTAVNDLKIDHLQQFSNYCFTKLQNRDIVEEELNEVLHG